VESDISEYMWKHAAVYGLSEANIKELNYLRKFTFIYLSLRRLCFVTSTSNFLLVTFYIFLIHCHTNKSDVAFHILQLARSLQQPVYMSSLFASHISLIQLFLILYFFYALYVEERVKQLQALI